MKCTIKFFIAIFAMLVMQIQAMTTQGTQILNSDGHPVELKGINWFGFNNGDTMVDGLWAGPDSLSMDFATVVYRMQLLGFNAVRLPFSFNDLYNASPRNYTQNSPTASQTEIQTSTTDPSVNVPAGSTIPAQIYTPPNATPGIANSYLPNDTTLNRFLWVINFFARNGFYVLIDDHTEDSTVLNGTNQWVQDWVKLVTAISQDPISKSMLMVDLLNEPDSKGIRWEASGNTAGLSALYIAAMDALYPINSDLIFFIEGAGQGGIQANWGDGFCTNPQTISSYGLSDPNPFFETLLAKPYLNQVVISPHVYPPSVTGASTDYEGTGLWNRLSTSFGYLTKQGYCSGSNCKVFPVVIGEFGSQFATSTDIQSMSDIAAYLNNSGGANDGLHNSISSWLYWDWNANSGDTGGIVENDWRTIAWTKIEYLTTIGLKPWYMSVTPAKTGNICVNVASVNGLKVQNLQPIQVGNYFFNVTAFNTPVCQTVPVGTYTVTAPTLTVGNTQYTAASQTITVSANTTSTAKVTYAPQTTPVTGPCHVAIQLGTPWQEKQGGPYYNTLNIYITNTGSTPINVPWTLALANSSYQGVSQYWNLSSAIFKNGVITAQSEPAQNGGWENLLPNGSPINVGMIVYSNSSNFMPTSVSINGTPCQVTQQK